MHGIAAVRHARSRSITHEHTLRASERASERAIIKHHSRIINWFNCIRSIDQHHAVFRCNSKNIMHKRTQRARECNDTTTKPKNKVFCPKKKLQNPGSDRATTNVTVSVAALQSTELASHFATTTV
jgi:hypothetical protein